MLEFDFEALVRAGPHARAGKPSGSAGSGGGSGLQSVLARITEVHRETVAVHDGRDGAQRAPLPRLVRTLADEATALAVGDWVLARRRRARPGWIDARVPPSHAHRAPRRRRPPPSGGQQRRHRAAGDGRWTTTSIRGALERYLALVQDDGDRAGGRADQGRRADAAPATRSRRVCRAARPRPAARRRARRQRHRRLGRGRAARLPRRGQTLVLLGSSGAGKSTLTNTLLGAHVQDTGAVREHDSRGKHTTTSRSLHLLPGGACVIDTPGLRTLRPDGDEAALAASFADIGALAAQCRFRDCRHATEPGCAVRDGRGRRPPAQLSQAAARDRPRHAHAARPAEGAGAVEGRAARRPTPG